ncbi:micrococcal nuclease [Solibacillus sp. R5-41]|uniref:thermonuclease family protein n=1 Tax=Solibacillus sp. R5-41 TaxID=2048654 RepID=UPI000C125240|nr:thermonuclease family protein [Solibacillus sp. R5-41]ATP39146.1 micrococcal nuclease [Solibacillus sp. R5-41]
MKLKDIKTLITSGTIILAVGLYLLFAKPTDERPLTNDSVLQQTTNDGSQNNTPSKEEKHYSITPELAMNETGKQMIDVEFISANDGDTMSVKMDGQKQRVRLLMIDTTEMNYGKGDPMPYAEEAKQLTTQLLEDAKSIQLLFDKGPEKDKYDRLLAYVFVDGVSLHEVLLSEGLAAVRYVNKPNNSLEDELRKIQQKAEAEKLNIWAHENYLQKDGFHPEEVKK